MKNTSFVFYASFHEALEELSDVKYGKLMRAINNYAINGVMPELKKELRMAFLLIKPQIDANTERRENGKSGGRPKKGAQVENCQTDCSVIEENDDKTASEQEVLDNVQENKKTTGYTNDETEKTIGGQNQKPNVNVNDNVNVERVAEAKPPPPSKTKRFVKPTVQEIADYCRSRNNSVDSGAFFNFYESKNWFVGKNKMSDWKAAIRTWEIHDRQRALPQAVNSHTQYDYNTVSSQEMPF